MKPLVVVRGPAVLVVLLLLTTCVTDGGATSGRTDSTGSTVTGLPPSDDSLADSTGAPLDPACIDDYHGNQSHQTALDLSLDTLDTAFIALGDGVAVDPPEVGTDELVVCEAGASDFFALETQCPAYLGIETRRLEGGVPELFLYDGSAQDGPPVERATGDWSGFFLKPLHRKVDAGSHLVEVRHSGGAPQRYSFTVTVLPDTPCPPP